MLYFFSETSSVSCSAFRMIELKDWKPEPILSSLKRFDLDQLRTFLVPD